MTWVEPPPGWFAFGTHIDQDVRLEFSDAVGEDALPLHERPKVEAPTLAPDSPWLASVPAAEPMTVSVPLPQLDSALIDVLFGGMPEDVRQAFALTFDYDVPYAGPVAPRKRRGLTGKAYRQARRRYHRQRVRWERAGRPGTAQARLYLPRVHIDPHSPRPRG